MSKLATSPTNVHSANHDSVLSVQTGTRLHFALPIVLALVSRTASAQVAGNGSQANCAAQIEKPAYPRIARIASIWGTVTARFTVGANGRAEELRVEGHLFLSQEVEAAINRTTFADFCKSQNIEVVFRFQLEGEPSDQPKTSVSFKPPNEYVLTSNSTGIIPVLKSEVNPKSADNSQPIARRPCRPGFWLGRRIMSHFEIVEFRVPRFAHMTKGRDVDYVIYGVRYGPKRDRLWLTFMFGPTVGGHSPHAIGNTLIKWTGQRWGCHQDEDGTDWRGVAADGRMWRHVSVPFGFAAYEGVQSKAAAYFDRILDTMCCGQCPVCKSGTGQAKQSFATK